MEIGWELKEEKRLGLVKEVIRCGGRGNDTRVVEYI